MNNKKETENLNEATYLPHLNLFDVYGDKSSLKVKTANINHFGEYCDGVITISDRIKPIECLLTVCHEYAHALWDRENMGKQASEEEVCEKIAEGLGQLFLSGQLDELAKQSKLEMNEWEMTKRTSLMDQKSRTAMDCEGIEELCKEWCDFRSTVDSDVGNYDSYGSRPADMTDNRDNNRELVRNNIRGVRDYRARILNRLHWMSHQEVRMLKLLTESVRVRYAWRHGHL